MKQSARPTSRIHTRVRSMHDSLTASNGSTITGITQSTEVLKPSNPSHFLDVPSPAFRNRSRSDGDISSSATAASANHDNQVRGREELPPLSYDEEYEAYFNQKLRNEDVIESSEEISRFDINSDEMLCLFQLGELKGVDEEWHRLVPPQAQDVLGKMEVQRQSVVFEIIKGERDYFADLTVVREVFIDGLSRASPPVIPESTLPSFIQCVFGNIRELLNLHKQLLNALFLRQREQHPLVQSVGDILLDTTVKAEFRSAYETYIKHYPLAESRHRKELRYNRGYANYLQSVSDNPRVRKRDLITFLSRPVTRLPRLSLLLEQVLKSTEKDSEHPDLETVPLTLSILHDFIKSTQPGIEVAESKVKFWDLRDNLIYRPGEMIDMDLYEDSRSLVYSSPVTRRIRLDTGFPDWEELTASLLDNYLLLTRKGVTPDKFSSKQYLISRPIHLSYLRLGSFEDPPEIRKERSEDSGFIHSLRSQAVPLYPFTIYHASSRFTRRYTLFVPSESRRRQWKTMLVEAIAVHRVREDSNKWFDLQKLSDRFFHVPTHYDVPPPSITITGRITSAVPFSIGESNFVAVGCARGIFVSVAGHDDFKNVLQFSNPKYIAAVQKAGNRVFNKFIVHSGSSLVSYSLDLLAQLALGRTRPQSLNASVERIGENEHNIVFAKYVQMDSTAMIIYASKRRLSSTFSLQVMEVLDEAQRQSFMRKDSRISSPSFRPLGEAGFVPRDAYHIIALSKSIGICTEDGVVIANPTNLAQSAVTLVPDFSDTPAHPLSTGLKSRLKEAKPLGLVRVDTKEFLMIYDNIGCYITKQGRPGRGYEYLRWETPAKAYAHRGNHILLFSSEFIEVRDIRTGRIVQVIEGSDMRLMYGGGSDDRILMAMKGDEGGNPGTRFDKLMQVVETTVFLPQTPSSARSENPDIWEEWEM